MWRARFRLPWAFPPRRAGQTVMARWIADQAARTKSAAKQ